MKTILDTEIPENIRAVLYLCDFDSKNLTITVTVEFLFQDAWQALSTFAEIPNPESQLVTGKTYKQLCQHLEVLHRQMKNKRWLKDLSECL